MPTGVLLQLLIIPLVLLVVLIQKKRRRGLVEANADATTGAIAGRLGLRLVSGDPTLNLLYFTQRQESYERRVLMRGTPYAHAVELDLADGCKVSYPKATFTFRCHLAVDVGAPFPDFEITLRRPQRNLEPRYLLTGQPGVGEAPTGQPALDAQLRVASSDPRVGAVVASALPLLANQGFVHVYGHGGRILTSLSRAALPYFASAPEEALFALESLACALEGRPAPARAPVPALATRLVR